MFKCLYFPSLWPRSAQIRIRGLELHDPDHTSPTLYSDLLSDPTFLKYR